MQYRTLGKTGYSVSTISFGAWAIGGSWGAVNDDDSLAALRKFVELGGNFIDTADVYGDGHSERLITRILKENPGGIRVATKAGRRLSPHVPEGYTGGNIEAFVDRSLKNLGVETLDLVQLHCPPTPVYGDEGFFDELGAIRDKGKVRFWGVSVETIDEAMTALRYDNVCTVQIIFNIFRQRPADEFFAEAKRRDVGILARVPLASGLLTGKLSPDQSFATDDHRNFNRLGQQFDAGETFSGLGDHLEEAFAAVEELRPLVSEGQTMAQFALRWILMHDAVTCAIPGARNAAQAAANVVASDLPPLTPEQMVAIRKIYETEIAAHVEGRW